MPQEPGELDTDGMAVMAQAIALEGYTFADFAGFDEKALEPAYALAFNLINQNQYYEAEKLLVWLCGIDHYQTKYFIGLGICRQQMGRHEKAVQAYAVAGMLDVNNPVPALRAAECYLAMGMLEEARSGCKAALHWAGSKPEHAALRARAEALLAATERKKGDA
jgi:type III secretion system low calcium response chaperone LcrH/SycD